MNIVFACSLIVALLCTRCVLAQSHLGELRLGPDGGILRFLVEFMNAAPHHVSDFGDSVYRVDIESQHDIGLRVRLPIGGAPPLRAALYMYDLGPVGASVDHSRRLSDQFQVDLNFVNVPEESIGELNGANVFALRFALQFYRETFTPGHLYSFGASFEFPGIGILSRSVGSSVIEVMGTADGVPDVGDGEIARQLQLAENDGESLGSRLRQIATQENSAIRYRFEDHRTELQLTKAQTVPEDPNLPVDADVPHVQLTGLFSRLTSFFDDERPRRNDYRNFYDEGRALLVQVAARHIFFIDDGHEAIWDHYERVKDEWYMRWLGSHQFIRDADGSPNRGRPIPQQLRTLYAGNVVNGRYETNLVEASLVDIGLKLWMRHAAVAAVNPDHIFYTAIRRDDGYAEYDYIRNDPSKRFIVMPYSQQFGGQHLFLMIYDRETGNVVIADSGRKPSGEDYYESAVVFAHILKHIVRLPEDVPNSHLPIDFRMPPRLAYNVAAPEIPLEFVQDQFRRPIIWTAGDRQSEGDSCGIYTLMNGLYLGNHPQLIVEIQQAPSRFRRMAVPSTHIMWMRMLLFTVLGARCQYYTEEGAEFDFPHCLGFESDEFQRRRVRVW